MSDLLDYCATNASWTSGKCAEVRVGDHVTRYVRRGSGSPAVVVVGVNAARNAVWGQLVDSLAVHHRLIIPQLPVGEHDVATWLRAFLEGIGLSSVALIAGDAARGPAIALASADEFTIQKLVLVPDGESGGANRASSDIEAATSDSPRTLRVRGRWLPAEAVEQVQRFIAPDGAGGSASIG